MNRKVLFSFCLTLVCVLALPVASQARKKSPAGAKLYFITPEDGATVTSPVTVRFGLKGMAPVISEKITITVKE